MTKLQLDQTPQYLRPPLPTASLVEVFSAIQGEGLNVGTRQIFIRWANCDLRCKFCDSVHTWHSRGTCRIEQSPGQRDFETYPNPVSISRLLDWVQQLNCSPLHDSISLTGGEPLLHDTFLISFIPQVRARTALPIYLETGGHRPTELAGVLSYLDCVGMDLKLPSVSGETRWSNHAECLKLCDDAGVDVFCKLVISANTDPAELGKAAQLVRAVSANIPVILQPVTPVQARGQLQPPTPLQVLDWQAAMKEYLRSVRVIPQTHKAIGQL